MTRCRRPGFGLAAVALAGLLLAGCAETELVAHAVKDSTGTQSAAPRSQSQGNYKVGNRYQIGGIWYQPREDFEHLETGVASWYGPGFHGRSTANGERFDMNDLTAAHRTLQMPSLVEVTNLENGRSVVLRVNDRGPFARDRVIDVSRRAAQLLGFEREGTARVRVAVLPEESRQIAEAVRQRLPEPRFIDDDGRIIQAAARPPSMQPAAMQPAGTQLAAAQPADAPQVQAAPRQAVAASDAGPVAAYQPDAYTVPSVPARLFVQAGAFSRSDNAQRLGQQLADVGLVSVDPAQVRGLELHRVRIGPLASAEEADRVLDTVTQRGVTGARIVAD